MTAGTRHGALVKHKAEVRRARRRRVAAFRLPPQPRRRTHTPPRLARLTAARTIAPHLPLHQVARGEAKFEADFKAFIAQEAAAEAATE